MIYGNLRSLTPFASDLTLMGLVALLILGEVVVRGRNRRAVLGGVAILGLGVALWALRRVSPGPASYLFHGAVAFDPMSLFFHEVFLVTAVVTVLLSLRSPEMPDEAVGEYLALIVGSTLGMSLLASSTDLLMIALSLELVSVPSYLLTGLMGIPRTAPGGPESRRRSSEASLKYVLYGAVASGTMLFGLSWMYGLTGSTHLTDVARVVAEGHPDRGALLAAVLFILVGFGFKMASVPFHAWCPDVFEGAPTPITAFFSVGPKAAGVAILLRFFYTVLTVPGAGGVPTPALGLDWPMIMAGVSILTMTLGNLAAIPQTNIKRMLAYSSIAHIGYILMGFVLLSRDGVWAILFYVAVYLFMNLGGFGVVVALSRRMASDQISAYKGLGWRAPGAAVLLTLFLFSLTGIPPLAGFIGKFYLFAAVMKAGWFWLAIIGVLNSAVSLYYYAGIVKQMFLEDPPPGAEPIPLGWADLGLLSALAAPLLVLGVYWTPLLGMATRATHLVDGL